MTMTEENDNNIEILWLVMRMKLEAMPYTMYIMC